MEQPSSHDLSEYQPIDLSKVQLGPDERRLVEEGWQCVKMYPHHYANPDQLAKNDAQAIREAGANAQVTYYTEHVHSVPHGREDLIVDEERRGARVWMKPPLPEMSFGGPV